MKKNYKIYFLIVMIIILFIFFQSKKINKNNSSEYFSANINLSNECSLIDDAFMVISLTTNKKAYFLEKKAKLNVKKKEKIQLVSSDKFPDFLYEGVPTLAKKKITLSVNCEEPRRIRNTLDALKNQFKN